MYKLTSKHLNSYLLITLGLFLANTAGAAGYYLHEKSARAVGMAAAGAVVEAKDSSSIFYNPAGMSSLQGTQGMVAGVFYNPTIRFQRQSSTVTAGSEGGNAGSIKAVPSFFASYQLNSDWHVGLGITMPFGFSIQYEDGWIGRYYGLRGQLKTTDINPAISYKVNDQLALGVGISATYIDVERVQAINFASILGVDGAGDGKVTLRGNGWGYGFNVGAMYDFTPLTRLGVSFRSQLKNTIKGRASFSTPQSLKAAIAASGAFYDTNGSTSVMLPDSASLGLSHKITKNWQVLGDVSWMNWSRLKEQNVKFGNLKQPPVITRHHFRDSWRYAMGTTYQIHSRVELTSGVAYTKSPVSDQHREVFIPESDSFTLAAGCNLGVTEHTTATLSINQKWLKQASLSLNESFKGRIAGTYKNQVTVFGVQLKTKF